MGNNIVFARTRWHYDSYVDYWDLVKLSGFPVVWIDEMDLSKRDTTYVISPMNGEVVPFMDQHPYPDRYSKVVMWNLERPSGSGGLQSYIDDNRRYIENRQLDEIIVSDRALAEHTGFKFVPLGSHVGLGTPSNITERLLGYDLIHLSGYSPHRAWMFISPEKHRRELEALTVAQSGWGEARRKALQFSRFMLNVHQDEYLYMEPLRFSLAAAYGLPIISEQCLDMYPYVLEWVVMGGSVRSLLRSAWLRNLELYAERYYRLGLEMRKVMTTTYSFRNCLEKYL